MAAKPSSLPRWSSVSGVVEPSSGQKDTGFEGGQFPPAQYFNWLFNLIYQWADYLDDGALVGAHSFSGLITATAGLTAAANQHVTVSGTGQHKHGARTIAIPASEFYLVNPVSGAAVAYTHVNILDTANAQYSWPSAAGTFVANVPMVTMKRITAVRIYYAVGASGTCTPEVRVKSVPSNGTPTSVWGGSGDSSNGGVEYQEVIAGFDATVADGHFLQLRLEVTTTDNRIHGALITYDE